MSLAVVYSRGSLGIRAPQVSIEVHLSNGLPGFQLVGLAETSVRESRDRVRSALLNSGFVFPAKRITVNLGPADLPKEGGRYDLAIALGILAADGQLPKESLSDTEIVGELSLSGQVRGVCGILPLLIGCLESQRQALLPHTNLSEARLVQGLLLRPVATLLEAFNHFAGLTPIQPSKPAPVAPDERADSDADLSDVIGQAFAKRALEIAAAGGHHLLFVGPPGSGKSMLASRLAGILPPLTEHQALQTATVYSVAGKPLCTRDLCRRPFRAPHHTCSAAAMAGGGSSPKPGEISLAHHGVLFLDELPEFERRVLDALREPLETGEVHISRAAGQASFPARFQLVAAMNPSPTGCQHDGRSTTEQMLRYLSRLSGPFLDRIDLQVEVANQTADMLHQAKAERAESSRDIRKRVVMARDRQLRRQAKINSDLQPHELDSYCSLQRADETFLLQVMNRKALSLRAVHRILRVARTIADLEGAPDIARPHLAEAMGYRAMDNLLNSLTENSR